MKQLRVVSLICAVAGAGLAQEMAPPAPPTPPAARVYYVPSVAPARPAPAQPATPAAPQIAVVAPATPWPTPAAVESLEMAPVPWPAPAAPQVREIEPVPPVPPVPAMAPVPPVPPVAIYRFDDQVGPSQVDQEQMRAARDMAQQVRDQQQEVREQQREIEQQAREATREAARFDSQGNRSFNFNFDAAQKMTLLQPRVINLRGGDNALYTSGQSAIDSHRYDQALEDFTEVVNRGGPRTEGALYWKAYTLNKLGRRDDALAAIAQLRKTYTSSKWLDEAKALEFDVQQAAGKPPSPESQGDDDLKLLALNGLVQSDPERALPLLDKLLKGPQSPALKKRAVFVLANSTSPKAQQSLEQIARGSLGNPDLQLVAISYMLSSKNQPNRNQVLQDIYASTNDIQVKRAILNAYQRTQDYDRLLQAAKGEKDQDLRRSAIGDLGDKTGQPELWQLWANETTPEGKEYLLRAMHNNGNTDKIAEVARTDKDPAVRQEAIRALADQRDSGPNTATLLINLYGTEQDAQVKRTIINAIADKRNAKGLVDIFHKEPNLEIKKSIVSRLAGIHSPEANELYLEILKP